jgi:hypothetical protein
MSRLQTSHVATRMASADTRFMDIASIKAVVESMYSGARVGVTEGAFKNTGRAYASVTLYIDETGKSARDRMVDDKDALVFELRARGLRVTKGDGMRYAGSDYSSARTGIRYNFIVSQ